MGQPVIVRDVESNRMDFLMLFGSPGPWQRFWDPMYGVLRNGEHISLSTRVVTVRPDASGRNEAISLRT